jgi:hypothetical protein
MKRIVLIAFAAALTANVFAQQKGASISFKEDKFDFGKIKEADGLVNHVFEFTNTGATPLLVQNAEPSCGCTTPDWTRQPVMPGAKGFVKATYNPDGRPGSFEKEIKITSNADRPMVVLKITGTVIPKAQPVEEAYRKQLGDLRMSTDYISFGTLNPGMVKTSKIALYNAGTKPIKIKFLTIPAHVKLAFDLRTLKSKQKNDSIRIIKPNQKDTINFRYNTALLNDWGFVIDHLLFSIDDRIDDKYKVTLSSSMVENFANLTAQQLADAPKFVCEKAQFDFGTIKEGDKVENEFKIRNDGKTDLVLHKIIPSCGCTTINPMNMVVKPGETTSLKFKFDSSGKKSTQDKFITVLSNDPKNPEMTLKIKGMVE